MNGQHASPPSRVVRIRESAVAGEFALTGGFSAWAISLLLRNVPGGVEKALTRNGVPPARVRDVVRAVEALEVAGASWRAAGHATASADAGNEERHFADPPAMSDDMNADEAAVILRRTPRRVRQAAAMGELAGHRVDGRWRFSRTDVLRYRAERDGLLNNEGME